MGEIFDQKKGAMSNEFSMQCLLTQFILLRLCFSMCNFRVWKCWIKQTHTKKIKQEKEIII